MTLVIGVMTLFIDVMTLIRGLVLRLVVSLIVYATQIVYITGLWSELKFAVQRRILKRCDVIKEKTWLD